MLHRHAGARSAGLAQHQRQNSPGAGPPEGTAGNGDGPAAVHEVVDEHHALAAECRPGPPPVPAPPRAGPRPRPAGRRCCRRGRPWARRAPAAAGPGTGCGRSPRCPGPGIHECRLAAGGHADNRRRPPRAAPARVRGSLRCPIRAAPGRRPAACRDPRRGPAAPAAKSSRSAPPQPRSVSRASTRPSARLSSGLILPLTGTPRRSMPLGHCSRGSSTHAGPAQRLARQPPWPKRRYPRGTTGPRSCRSGRRRAAVSSSSTDVMYSIRHPAVSW